ncbi:MAG TPA: hypothetical protein VI698_03335 [Nitrososphaerales archaeon]|nr:hypothetical protein [Nitrososphaerales archaeon]
MRILTSLTDEFSLQLNKIHNGISEAALRFFKPVMQGTETSLVKPQYGPIEVEKVNLFSIEDVQKHCKKLQALLKGWDMENAPSIAPLGGATLGATKRLSAVFSAELNSIKISCTFNIQYSSKNYYRLDRKIMSLQEELAKIESEINSTKADAEKRIWSAIKEELRKKGVPVDDENYITQVSRNENYLSELLSDFMDLSNKYESLLSAKDPKIDELENERASIVGELETFLIEANVTEPLLLDELGISTRKSGLFVYMDIRNTTGSDLPREDISEQATSSIATKFKEMEDGLNELAKRSVN